MKINIGESAEEVEILNYRTIDKGALRGSFSLALYPQGQTIFECKHFSQGEKEWFSLPQKEIKYPDGRKSQYIPLVTYNNKEYFEKLREATMEGIRHAVQNQPPTSQRSSPF